MSSSSNHYSSHTGSHSSSHSACHSGNTCKEFAKILGAEILTSTNNLCVATFTRNIDAEILGRPTHSPLALAALFSFEDVDSQGKALNLGETVILQEEINEFISILREHNIKVTALHNHWLFDRPRLMYIHFESIDNPLAFARKVADALQVLK